MLEENLKDKIIKEMVVDYKVVLDKDFNLAKNLIKITPEGKVNVLLRDKLTGKEQILSYLIGKLYSKEAGFSETENVSNDELMKELAMPKGSVLPWTKELRDNDKVRQINRGVHAIPLNLVDDILKELAKKVGIETV